LRSAIPPIALLLRGAEEPGVLQSRQHHPGLVRVDSVIFQVGRDVAQVLLGGPFRLRAPLRISKGDPPPSGSGRWRSGITSRGAGTMAGSGAAAP
jgi:hypothetical protein